jgi:hypothetical protein
MDILADRARKKTEEENAAKRAVAAKYENNNKTETTTRKPETQQPVNLIRGIALYKGQNNSGMVIEVEADVLFVNKAPKGMAGLKYKHIYQAVTRRYRFPGNSSRWISYSGSSIDFGGRDGNNIWIGGMQFFLNEPGINLY